MDDGQVENLKLALSLALRWVEAIPKDLADQLRARHALPELDHAWAKGLLAPASQIPTDAHFWVEGTLSEGELVCSRCKISNFEASARGLMDYCGSAQEDGP
jgi:hypothetical protein